MEPAQNPPNDAELGAVAARLGRCVLTRVSNAAMYFARTERHLRPDCCGYLRLRMYLKGRSVGVLGEDPFQLTAGQIQIFDFSRPYRLVITESETIAVLIPHAAVGYDPARHPGQFNFSPESPWGRVLEESTWSLFNRLPDLRQSEADRLAENYCALIRGVIHMECPDEAAFAEARQARQAAIRRFIDQNLNNPELKASDVCIAFNMSRASVYREFEDTGGFGRYITQRRLEEAMRDLACACRSRGLIKRVSARWGFHDPSHFHRLFRAEFGFSPSEFVDLCETEAAPPRGLVSRSGRRERQVPDISMWLKCDTGTCPAD